MKNQNGITLTSLVIYVIAMVIVLGIMSSIITEFYKNTNNLNLDTDEIVQFNNFNTYFLKTLKTKGNKVDSIKDNYILFSSGDSFSFDNHQIYYNNVAICNGVEKFTILLGKNGDGINQDIVYVTLVFENFTKSINYKIEEIY